MQKYTISDETKAYAEIQEMRKEFESNPKSVIDGIRVKSSGEALEKAVSVVQNVTSSFSEEGYEYICPGHAKGHVVRDYANALMLFSEMDAEVSPKDIFAGFIGGSLHDIGNAIVPRFQETTTLVRHAEAGALFTKHLLEQSSDLNDAEKLAMAYSIAAHTHYLGEQKIVSKDGEEKGIIKPYVDLYADGNPILSICFARKVARIDCNGPTFIGRHYLTQAEEYEDFAGISHFNVKFDHHMTPLLRSKEKQADENGKRNPTMSESMKGFADTQNNNSPYGKHDFGTMIRLRDRQTERLYRIVQDTQIHPDFSKEREMQIRTAWTSYLGNNVEPSELGRKAAATIDEMFGQLEDSKRKAWTNAFLTTMQEQMGYAYERLEFLEKIDKSWLKLPGMSEDVREMFKPRKSWMSAI